MGGSAGAQHSTWLSSGASASMVCQVTRNWREEGSGAVLRGFPNSSGHALSASAAPARVEREAVFCSARFVPGREAWGSGAQAPLRSGLWSRSSRRPRGASESVFLPWPTTCPGPPPAPYLDGFRDVTNGSRVQAHQTRHLVADSLRVFEPAGAEGVGRRH